jgi:hypothetical protein
LSQVLQQLQTMSMTKGLSHFGKTMENSLFRSEA